MIRRSEWETPHEKPSCIHTPIHNVWRNPEGTETSVTGEKKRKLDSVSGGERTRELLKKSVRARWGYRLHLRFCKASRTVLGKPAGEGESPVSRESRAD